MSKDLMKSDGNGGVIIPSWFLTVASILLVIISTVSGVVAASATTTTRVDNLETNLEHHTEETQLIKSQVNACQLNIAIISTKYDNIKEDLESIDAKLDKLIGD